MTIVFLFAVLVAGPVWAAFPQPQGFVNDFANVLDRRSQSELQVLAEQLRADQGVELAVVTVASTDPLDPKEYTTGLFNEWGIGGPEDSGLLILLAVAERAIEVEPGYGLEGVLPDAKVKQIIEQIIIPQFKSGNLSQGIGAGVDAMLRLIQGESLPSPVAKKSMGLFTDSTGTLDVIAPLLIGFFILGKILEPLLGRLGGAVVTSIGAGFISWLLMASIAIAITVAIFALIMNLFHSPGTGIYRGGRSHWPNDSYRGDCR